MSRQLFTPLGSDHADAVRAAQPPPTASHLPFRLRSLFGDRCLSLGRSPSPRGASDRFEVLVLPKVAHGLRVAAARSAPKETFGLLGGRVFRDGEGSYVVVTSMVMAHSLDASAGHVRVPPVEIDRLRRRLEASAPTHDLIGWWHTHHRPSGYSGTDFSEQASWPDPEHVGLLVFMHADTTAGEPWAYAYRGPGAELLLPVPGPKVDSAPSPTAPEAIPDRTPAKSDSSAEPPAEPPHPVDSPSTAVPRWRAIVLAAVVVVTLTVLVAAIASHVPDLPVDRPSGIRADDLAD